MKTKRKEEKSSPKNATENENVKQNKTTTQNSYPN
jgi:hypothetical protein